MMMTVIIMILTVMIKMADYHDDDSGDDENSYDDSYDNHYHLILREWSF
jgi:hypothetical protein